MVAGLEIILNVPIAIDFFQLVWPREDALMLIAGLCAAGIVLIGIIRAVQQTYIRRQLTSSPVAAPTRP